MMIDTLVEQFHAIMRYRPVAIAIMLSAALGAVVSIAGGFYGTYLVVTALQN